MKYLFLIALLIAVIIAAGCVSPPKPTPVVTSIPTPIPVVTSTPTHQPIALFSAIPLSGTAPLTVQFINLATNAETYTWDFGDGSISSLAKPTHTYTNIGKYTVTLTATNALGSDVQKIEGFITVTTYPPPLAIPTTTKPLYQTFKIGESATNGKVRISVNSKNFNDKIDNMAPHNKSYQWLTADITFINSDASEIAYGGYFYLTDADGFSYDEGGWSSFEKQLFSFGNRDVLPGETRRGNIYFEIPKTSKNLKLKYNFGRGQIAVFDLG